MLQTVHRPLCNQRMPPHAVCALPEPHGIHPAWSLPSAHARLSILVIAHWSLCCRCSSKRASSPQQGVGARPASGLYSAGRTPPDSQSQLQRPPSAGLGRPGSINSRDACAAGPNILRDGPGSRSQRRAAVPLLGGGDSSSDGEDAPVQVRVSCSCASSVSAFILGAQATGR